ncbi:FMN-binding protein [Stieleria sp. TO1_6]|uniref:FMN-binding protein n=1 Tax=Stieleria tagensis TaxID=2956795 RepID=UPI00209A82A2|nr:FMN-binding protein [Stieleria tagensis]MCO8121901.1 FMN-binding protein [Stieleria tagensis]
MQRRRKSIVVLVHLIRVGIVVALLVLLPSQRSAQVSLHDGSEPPAVDQVRRVIPGAAAIQTEPDAAGFWRISDSAGHSLGSVARTLPQAADVIGYRGPSEALIVVDDQLKLVGVDLLQSADTEEHVAAVKKDHAFFQQFQTWRWSGPPPGTDIDAVSGATLTSLAIAQGVLKRVGGDRPSLVFPDSIDVQELERWFPQVATVHADGDSVVPLDAAGKPLGRAIRSGPLSDNVVGYQGPTELLMRLDHDPTTGYDIVGDIKIRSSFDNEPYVGYCRSEYSFWPLFEGQTVSSLAAMDLEQAGVEGVSGATMTSMAIAETLVMSAQQIQSRAAAAAAQKLRQPATFWQRLKSVAWSDLQLRLTSADVVCAGLLLCIPLFRGRGWFRQKTVRLLWLLTVIGVIGLWSGNLISLALVAGWSSEGIAWRLAPALALIVVVAFGSPAVGKSNPYCNHICPHGAIQQILRPTSNSRRHWKMPQRWIAVLGWLPGTMLGTAYVLLLLMPTIDLAAWEPFHAYLYRIAPWTAIGLAGMTLLFSAFVPMGYCRLGCPTGRLLDHLRRSARSDRIRLADAVAAGLLVLAIYVRARGI